MYDDLTNSATPTPTIARIARKLLVASSVILALGLSGVVLARAEQQRRASVVWVGRGMIALPVPVAASEPVELLHDKIPVAASIKPQPVTKRIIRMEVTAYCPCIKCCGPQAQGLTASGKHVSYNDGKFVAADTRLLPFGTRLTIPGYADGQPVEVIDRGGAIKGEKLDVYFPTHEQALEWGRQHLWITIE